MIYSGIDWSGDPGQPGKSSSPMLVIGLAHVDGSDLQSLSSALAMVRERQRLGGPFPFKFAACSNNVRLAFFAAMATVNVGVYLSMIDKGLWYPLAPGTRPHQMLDAAVARLVCSIPPELIAAQVLLIDLPKSERSVVIRMGSAIKSGLKGAGIRQFPQIKPCPDTRTMGEIVQVADMFAGAVREGGPCSPWLANLGHRYALV